MPLNLHVRHNERHYTYVPNPGSIYVEMYTTSDRKTTLHRYDDAVAEHPNMNFWWIYIRSCLNRSLGKFPPAPDADERPIEGVSGGRINRSEILEIRAKYSAQNN